MMVQVTLFHPNGMVDVKEMPLLEAFLEVQRHANNQPTLLGVGKRP